MDTSKFECNICFETNQASNKYTLKCCRNNLICFSCVSKLKKPECPFCRIQLISLNSKKSSSRRRSNSLDSSLNENDDYNLDYIFQNHVNAFDDMTYYSRIYRRKQIRLLKLKQQEENRIQNRFRESILRSKKYSTSMKQQIRDDIDHHLSFR